MTTAPLAVASAALPGLDPGRVCALAAEHGLDGVEWGVGVGQALPLTVSDAQLAAVATAAASHGLACAGVAVHEPEALAYPAALWHRICDLAVVLGAPHVRVYATGRDTDFDSGFAGLRELLADKARATAERGLRLLLEPAPATLVPDPALARRALSGVDSDSVGVVYDPGSLAREGWQDPFLATGVLGVLLRHVHVKNVAPRRNEDGSWVWQRTGLDTGIVDWSRVSDALDAAGYAGWFVLDHLSSHEPGSLAVDLVHLRKLAEVSHA
ncbi:sugar phosphate isomerase/epimerase [Amycolatopsis sp. NPDC049253]|uniref:sugar phosphate isomerase/epimerase family protein n=1 Tax=Amycolatopsis sp. NPDC049253 TaxID=3155274 RepID=UPI00343A856E